MNIQSKPWNFYALDLDFKSSYSQYSRPATTLESLAKLRPVFKKDGVVTAGNASVCI